MAILKEAKQQVSGDLYELAEMARTMQMEKGTHIVHVLHLCVSTCGNYTYACIYIQSVVMSFSLSFLSTF